VAYIGDDAAYALKARTGAEEWSFETGGSIESSLAVAHGVVFASSTGGALYALNAKTGGELWAFGTSANIISSPTLANGVVYFGSDDGNVYALNAATGSQLWEFSTGGKVESSAAFTNGVVYIGSVSRCGAEARLLRCERRRAADRGWRHPGDRAAG